MEKEDYTRMEVCVISLCYFTLFYFIILLTYLVNLKNWGEGRGEVLNNK